MLDSVSAFDLVLRYTRPIRIDKLSLGLSLVIGHLLFVIRHLPLATCGGMVWVGCEGWCVASSFMCGLERLR
jgi:hypothetical protein